VLAEPHLYQALSMIDSKDSSQTPEIVSSLKEYVAIYQREHSGALPANMEVIYDYMQDAGETAWNATPAVNVSTKDIDPLGTRTDNGSRTLSTAPSQLQPSTVKAPESDVKKPLPRRRP